MPLNDEYLKVETFLRLMEIAVSLREYCELRIGIERSLISKTVLSLQIHEMRSHLNQN
ncbi:hypothetical protein [Fischerella sp. JS2]|uniref:hypothetical protein n=1 Tax=Fischerella sp. JS2 TaxID=2597771 RepID=UPI0028E71E4F|nr:hypothetical protein [Fischerella sp. JS2]